MAVPSLQQAFETQRETVRQEDILDKNTVLESIQDTIGSVTPAAFGALAGAFSNTPVIGLGTAFISDAIRDRNKAKRQQRQEERKIKKRRKEAAKLLVQQGRFANKREALIEIDRNLAIEAEKAELQRQDNLLASVGIIDKQKDVDAQRQENVEIEKENLEGRSENTKLEREMIEGGGNTGLALETTLESVDNEISEITDILLDKFGDDQKRAEREERRQQLIDSRERERLLEERRQADALERQAREKDSAPPQRVEEGSGRGSGRGLLSRIFDIGVGGVGGALATRGKSLFKGLGGKFLPGIAALITLGADANDFYNRQVEFLTNPPPDLSKEPGFTPIEEHPVGKAFSSIKDNVSNFFSGIGDYFSNEKNVVAEIVPNDSVPKSPGPSDVGSEEKRPNRFDQIKQQQEARRIRASGGVPLTTNDGRVIDTKGMTPQEISDIAKPPPQSEPTPLEVLEDARQSLEESGPRTQSSRSREAHERKLKLLDEAIADEKEKQLHLEEEKTEIIKVEVEKEKDRIDDTLFYLERLFVAREEHSEAAQKLADFEKEAGEQVEIGFSQEKFDYEGDGSIMGYADPEQQKRFEELRESAELAEEKRREAKNEAVEVYAREGYADPGVTNVVPAQDLRVLNAPVYERAESMIEEDFSQLSPDRFSDGEFAGLKRIQVNPDETPPRRKGGPVEAGSNYIVGEEGAELFIPNSDGTVIPNTGTVLGDDSNYQDVRDEVMRQQYIADELDRQIKELLTEKKKNRKEGEVPFIRTPEYRELANARRDQYKLVSNLTKRMSDATITQPIPTEQQMTQTRGRTTKNVFGRDITFDSTTRTVSEDSLFIPKNYERNAERLGLDKIDTSSLLPSAPNTGKTLTDVSAKQSTGAIVAPVSIDSSKRSNNTVVNNNNQTTLQSGPLQPQSAELATKYTSRYN